MALFTGAFFVAQVSLIIVAKPFYAIFCTSCVPHKPKAGFTACQMVDNLERLGTLWYAMKQIWRTKKIIKMASNIEVQKKLNPEKPDVPLNKNDAFQKVQKRRVQEKR